MRLSGRPNSCHSMSLSCLFARSDDAKSRAIRYSKRRTLMSRATSGYQLGVHFLGLSGPKHMPQREVLG